MQFPGSWDVDEPGLIEVAQCFALSILDNYEQSNQHSLMVHLKGELGAGKTTFVRGLLTQLGVSAAVKSPTYTLVETYSTNIGRIAHYDLYRVADPGELEFIGFRESISESTVTLIEWPEHAAAVLGAANWSISIAYIDAGRRLQVSGEFP